MKRIDREAMRRAIEELRRKGGEDLRQIEQKLRDEPWEDVGRFAAYFCQDEHLQLEPWQVPPCWLRTDRDVEAALSMPHDHSGRREAGELVQRLLAAGLSPYEPNPLEALERVEAERTLRPSSKVFKADERDTDAEPAGEEPRV
jgi:hypothetical protein